MKNLEKITAIRKAANIDALPAYFESLVARYQWPADRALLLQKAIRAVAIKQNDPHLYLGIIGEFSSGKSTLINTMMRDDFLQTANLQGTTTTLTAFRYGAQPDLTISYHTRSPLSHSKDRKQINKLYSGYLSGKADSFGYFSALWRVLHAFFKRISTREKIRQLTQVLAASEAFAGDISQLTVYYPAASLKNGLIIMDTPGIESHNKRHAEVTGHALKEICDTALILIQSTAPVPLSLIAFLKANARNIPVHRCIFLVTKIDQIRESERHRLVGMMRDKLAAELGTPAPTVIAVSALAALESLLPDLPASGLFSDSPPETRDQYLQDYLKAESGIYLTLNQQKLIIQLERLIGLTGTLFEEIRHSLQEFEQVYAKEKATLESTRIPSLAAFTRERKADYAKALKKYTKTCREDLEDCIHNFWDQFLGNTRWRLDDAGSFKELRAAVDYISGASVTRQSQLQEQVTLICEQVVAIVNGYKISFETEFNELYHALASFSKDAGKNEGRLTGTEHTFSSYATAHEANAVAEQANSMNNITLGASLATGAAIGTLVLPGIGTAIGAALGWLISKLFGPSLDEVRSDCQLKIAEAVVSIRNQWLSNGAKAFDQTMTDALKQLDLLIDHYMEKYRVLAEQLTEKERIELLRLEALRRQVNTDLQDLDTRKSLLAAAKKDLFLI